MISTGAMDSTTSQWPELLAGGAIAIFAFLLAVLWDLGRGWRARRRQERAVLRASIGEVEAAHGVATNNRNLIASDLAALAQGQRMTNPLEPVSAEYWVSLRIDPPESLFREEDGLSKVQEVSRLAHLVGELIRSREAFRVSNQALGSFTSQMTNYGQLIERFLDEYLEALDALRGALDRAALRRGVE